MTLRKPVLHRTAVLWALPWIVSALVISLPASSHAEEDKEERTVEVAKPAHQTERPTLKDEQEVPKFKAANFRQEKSFESLQRQDEAIVYLRDLIRSTPESNPQRAEFLFNLSELYWDRSKYYERSSVEKNDECYVLEDKGETKRVKGCRAQVQDMLNEAKRLREEAVQLYVDIIQAYPDFKDLDKVYFHLGMSLMEDGKQEQALQIFRRLIADFPDTEFVPEVLLNFAEYYFENDDMRSALSAYQKVAEYPESSVYTYAMYKQGWTHFNLGDKERAVEQFLRVIRTARERPNDPNSQSLVRQTRNDLVRTYAHVGSPDKALAFFKKEKIVEDESDLLDVGERLAIHYSDMGKMEESTRMYRHLISVNQNTIRTIDFQYEIVRNQTTKNAYSKESVEELVRLMKLVQLADQDHFPDRDAKKYPQTNQKVEELVRTWSTTYHREAQKTKNLDLYAMAYYLYKFYLETFPRSEHLYATTFFYGELLYQLEKWEEAAETYEKVLALNPKGEYTEDAVHATVLAYFKVVNTSEEQVELSTDFDEEKGKGDEAPKVPEPQELPEMRQRLMRACKMYVDHAPEGDKIVDVKYTMARTYYDFNHLREAEAIFRDIAFKHSDHRLAVIAANLHLDSLNLLQDFEGLHQAVLAYLEEEPIRDESFMNDAHELNVAIRFKKCTLLDDGERWEEAAQCFIAFARDFPESDFVDKALYNAALDFERMKEIGKAINIRIYFLKAQPNSPLAAETLFNIGGNFHALAVYSEASRFYEMFVKNFPEHEHAEAALTNASTFRQGLGEYDQALQNYERYLELFGKANPEKAAEVYFQMAQIYERQNKKRAAFDQYESYIKRYARHGSKDRLLEAHVFLGLYYWEREGRKNRRRAMDEFERTLKIYERLSDDEKKAMTSGRDAAAQAKFMIGESVFEKMVAIDINSRNEKELQKRLRDKMKVAEEAQKIYEEVILFGRPDWAIAALYRIGTQYEEFANTIRKSPVPKRLTYDQQEIYRGILEDRASEIEQRAVNSYEQALDTARQANWFNQYSKKAEVQLAQLRPREYRRPSERRAEPNHFSEGFTRAPFIKSVEEEDMLNDFSGSSEEAAPQEEEVVEEPNS